VDIVARQVIRAVRGKRSQEAFSRRLGYTSNPVADWEAGRRFPTAAEFLRACTIAGIPWKDAFTSFTPDESSLLGEGDDPSLAAWLSALRGNTSIKELADRIGESRYAVARWLSGETRPRLPDFLQTVQALTSRLSDLVAALVPIEEVAALQDEHHRRHASRRVAFEEPWAAAVMCVLETKAYAELPHHEDQWVADRLEIAVDVASRCLARLQDAGLVVRSRGHLHTKEQLTIDATADPEGTQRLKAHWAALGPSRATAPHDGDLVSYNVVAVAREDLERIREAHVRYFMEVRSIVANSRPEVAALVNIQLLTWDR
jgi:transcriptional regulator with XRE-family HTH domain